MKKIFYLLILLCIHQNFCLADFIFSTDNSFESPFNQNFSTTFTPYSPYNFNWSNNSNDFNTFNKFNNDFYNNSTFQPYNTKSYHNSLKKALTAQKFNNTMKNLNKGKFSRFKGRPTGFTPPVNTNFNNPKIRIDNFYNQGTPDWINSSTNTRMRVKILD